MINSSYAESNQNLLNEFKKTMKNYDGTIN